MKRFLEFRVIDYVYYIQDIRVNSIIEDCIHPIRYKKLIEVYRKFQYQNNLRSSYSYKKKLRLIAQDISLTIIDNILDIDDDLRTTRALAIAEQINFKYGQEDDYNSGNDSDNNPYDIFQTETMSDSEIPPPPPTHYSTQSINVHNTTSPPIIK